jgi:hypothetical protein
MSNYLPIKNLSGPICRAATNHLHLVAGSCCVIYCRKSHAGLLPGICY